MLKTLRWIHLACVGLFGGSLVMLLVLAAVFDPISPTSFNAVRQAMTIGSQAVVVPALLVALVSGLLLMVAKPGYIEARWVWGKVALGLMIGWIAFAEVQPAMNRATGYAVQAAIGSVIQSGASAGAASAAPMYQALEIEQRGRWINVGLVLIATLLSVFRPRLGGASASVHGVLPVRRVN